MSNRIQPIYIFLTLIGLVLICNGCTTSLLVSSATAAPSGATYMSGSGGTIESYQAVTFEDTIKATRAAAEILSLEVKQEQVDADRVSFQYADNGDRRVNIVIEQRTATLTYLKVTTGMFGDHGLGRILTRQILLEISDAGDLLE